MRRSLVLPLLMLLLGCADRAFCLTGEEARQLLTEGTRFFDEANAKVAADPAAARDLYRKALLRFTRIAEEGGIRNERLYYDIGNTHFYLGNIGRAILNYRRALLYDAGDPNLLQNLGYAREKRVDKMEEKQQTQILRILFFWHYDLSPFHRLVLFLAAFWVVFASAIARLFTRRAFVTWILGFAVAVAVLAGGSLSADGLSLFRTREGVILQTEVTARKGNALSYQPSFEQPLHEGTEFTLLEERSLWYYVELPDGRRCWIPREAAELVR